MRSYNTDGWASAGARSAAQLQCRVCVWQQQRAAVRPRRGHRSRSVGQAYLEAAIVIPAFAVFLVAILALARVAMTAVAIRGLAHRVALVPSHGGPEALAARLQALLAAEQGSASCAASDGLVTCTAGTIQVTRATGPVRQPIVVKAGSAAGIVAARAQRYDLWR